MSDELITRVCDQMDALKATMLEAGFETLEETGGPDYFVGICTEPNKAHLFRGAWEQVAARVIPDSDSFLIPPIPGPSLIEREILPDGRTSYSVGGAQWVYNFLSPKEAENDKRRLLESISCLLAMYYDTCRRTDLLSRMEEDLRGGVL